MISTARPRLGFLAPELVVAACVLAVSCGTHTCARKQDGTLWCWGSNFYGQLGDGTMDGLACGISPCKPSPVQVATIGNMVVVMTAGAFHTCAGKTDGTVWCWGGNGFGQLGDGSTGGLSCGGGVCKPVPVQAKVACP